MGLYDYWTYTCDRNPCKVSGNSTFWAVVRELRNVFNVTCMFERVCILVAVGISYKNKNMYPHTLCMNTNETNLNMQYIFLKNSSPKNENLLQMYSPSDHSRCRWVSFFIWTDLEKFSITTIAHQCNCSEWVPSEWEFKQLIKTSQ